LLIKILDLGLKRTKHL